MGEKSQQNSWDVHDVHPVPVPRDDGKGFNPQTSDVLIAWLHITSPFQLPVLPPGRADPWTIGSISSESWQGPCLIEKIPVPNGKIYGKIDGKC